MDQHDFFCPPPTTSDDAYAHTGSASAGRTAQATTSAASAAVTGSPVGTSSLDGVSSLNSAGASVPATFFRVGTDRWSEAEYNQIMAAIEQRTPRLTGWYGPRPLLRRAA